MPQWPQESLNESPEKKNELDMNWNSTYEMYYSTAPSWIHLDDQKIWLQIKVSLDKLFSIGMELSYYI